MNKILQKGRTKLMQKYNYIFRFLKIKMTCLKMSQSNALTCQKYFPKYHTFLSLEQTVLLAVTSS